MICITGTYVWRDGARFDHQIYETEHLALTRELLGPLGLTRLEALRLIHPNGPREGEAIVVTQAQFETLDQARAALAQAGPQLAAHISRYTDLQPQLRLAEIKT
ncbi:EthD family reductase [Paucibacter sp. APW11]|uniref:EthD family reductase n=1 Tax=Roseateles aquae TaxID=3077235 RepID=A0ABU3PIM5_9BURK|nr:EthD family reductase [Paucibacter sp. APW11]MDT9001963.1 EthD family reductase [Paucibacter sp. APW11]